MESIYLQPVISKLLVDLKNTAFGLDGIGAMFLKKLSSQFITQPLAFICIQSLTEDVFPNQLKLANIIPLYKADNRMLFNHYRPVSPLCVLSKVFERVMYTRLFFLENFTIIYRNQFGLIKAHSTYMALIILMDNITKSLENYGFVVSSFLDFSKAFDTVNHDILLTKLHHYMIRGTALKLFRSCLSDRYRYVTSNGVESLKKK